VNNESKRELHKGDGFGELALLYNAPRSASCKTVTACKFWGIDRQTFKDVVQEIV
jgi:cGMP-dependent protein kinase